MNCNNIKVIVTGGAGFVGSHVCDLLVNEGFKVHVVDDLSTGKKEYINKKATFEYLDITSEKKVFELVSKISPKYIFHLAAWPRIGRSMEDPLGTHKVNVEGTLVMLEAARRAGVGRFVYSSSSSVYGEQKSHIMKEDFIPNPGSHYAIQKLIGEEYCSYYARMHGLEIVSLRYFNVYGERQSDEGVYALVIGKFLNQLKNKQKLTVYGDGTQSRDFTFVKDIAKANLLSVSAKLNKGTNTIVNIGTAKETSVNRIVDLLGGKAKYIIPNPRGKYEEKRKVADISLAGEILGWEPTANIEKGLLFLQKK
ncbi:MAG: NAD-dependent epimerase/dehydratase family protein [bacterium]|nr:NAD-dependent epimerase/dehydratase family protein [bacterium]